LGSITFISGRNIESKNRIKSSLHTAKSFISLAGNNTDLQNIYPWIFHEDCSSMIRQRTERIRYITFEIFRAVGIRNPDLCMTDFQHGVFLVLKIGKENVAEDIIKTIASKARQLNLPLHHQASFWLSDCSIDYNKNYYDGISYLRICGGDIDTKFIPQISQLMRKL
jgi:hypothetical protein